MCNQAYRCVELFAGVGNISRMMRFANVATASHDIAYGKKHFQHKEMSPMDLCTPAGFASPGFKCTCRLVSGILQCTYLYSVQLRLCVWLILSAAEDDFLLVLAVVCTSFCAINKGSNRRDALVPYGDQAKNYVAQGNLLLERSLD